jgi:hypothetical protein
VREGSAVWAATGIAKRCSPPPNEAVDRDAGDVTAASITRESKARMRRVKKYPAYATRQRRGELRAGTDSRIR